MLKLLLWAELGLQVIAAGVLLTLAFGLALGRRVHFWLWSHAPAFEQHLPTDAGAWTGLALAIVALSA